MINKMNRSMVPETPIEKEIESLLLEARESESLIDFAEGLKEDLKEISMPFYSYRVKKVHSAIRTFRIAKYKKVEDMQDLFGILIIVDDEKDIKKVVQKIKNRLGNNCSEYNLLREKEWIEQKTAGKKTKYNPKEGQKQILLELKRVFANTEDLEKVLPPFSYIILSHIMMNNRMIPVEIRIQSKVGFQIVESSYFTIYKNDEIDPKIKAPLLFIIHQLMNRKTKLDRKKHLNIGEEQKLLREMGELYQYNFNILCENRDIILDAWREYAKISTKYKLKLPVYDFHFFDIKGKSEETIKLIEDKLDQIFEEFKSYDLKEIDVKSYIKTCIHDLEIEGLI